MVPVYAATAGFQVLTGLAQADAMRKQAAIQSQVDELNAGLAEYDAWKTEAYGQTQVARYQTTIDQAEGSAKVQAAAAGIDLSEGSMAQLAEQSKTTGFLNQIDILNAAHEKALGYVNQARNIRLQSGLNTSAAEIKATNTEIGAIGQAAGTAVSGYTTGMAIDARTGHYKMGSSGTTTSGLGSAQQGGFYAMP